MSWEAWTLGQATSDSLPNYQGHIMGDRWEFLGVGLLPSEGGREMRMPLRLAEGTYLNLGGGSGCPQPYNIIHSMVFRTCSFPMWVLILKVNTWVWVLEANVEHSALLWGWALSIHCSLASPGRKVLITFSAVSALWLYEIRGSFPMPREAFGDFRQLLSCNLDLWAHASFSHCSALGETSLLYYVY